MALTLSGNPLCVHSCLDTPPSNPISLLKQWLYDAESVGVSEPFGFVLSTINAKQHPWSRVVLLKEVDATGIVFATSARSAKGRDMEAHPIAAGNLWWRETLQQITFFGPVTALSRAHADAIFKSRPRTAQAVATLTTQSAPMDESEEALRQRVETLLQSEDIIPTPPHMMAYHIHITSIEFWHGSNDRLHRRLRYDWVEGAWAHQRLQP